MSGRISAEALYTAVVLTAIGLLTLIVWAVVDSESHKQTACEAQGGTFVYIPRGGPDLCLAPSTVLESTT